MLAHQAGGELAQRDHAGAGEGGHVDQGGRFEALGIGQRVAQDQAAFGVGVADLDGLAGHGGDHVRGAVAVAVDRVLHRRGDHHQVQRQLHLHRGHEGAQHAAGAEHVVLHLLDPALGLEVDPAGVEGDALADQYVGLGGRVGGAVPLQHDQVRAVDRAAGHGQQRAHAQRLHLRLVQDLGLGAFVHGGELPRLGGQVGRGADVGRQVAQFAGEGHAGGDRLALGQGGGVLAGNRQLAQARFVLFLAQGGGVAVGGVVGGDDGLADVPGRIAAGHRHFGQGEQGPGHRPGLQRADRIGHRLEVLRHPELAGFTQSDHQHPRCGHPGQVVQQHGLAAAAGQVAALEQGGQASAAGRVDGLAGGGQGLVGKGADHHAVEAGAGGGVAVQGELQGH